MERKTDWSLWIVIGIIVLALVALFPVVKIAMNDSGQCINNPFIYGAMKLEESTGQTVTGIVTIANRGQMTFNSSNMIGGTRFQNSGVPYPNLSFGQ